MPFTGQPDSCATPIPKGKSSVVTINRNLPFQPLCASTPINSLTVKATRDGEMEKGKAGMGLRRQDESAAVEPRKSQTQKSSESATNLQSGLRAKKNQGSLGVKRATSETGGRTGVVETIQADVEKLVTTKKPVSLVTKKAVVNTVDAQRKIVGQVRTRTSMAPEGEGNMKERLRSRSGSVQPLDNAIEVASKLRKRSESAGGTAENVPQLGKGDQNADGRMGQISKRGDGFKAVRGQSSRPGRKVTETTSESGASVQNRTDKGKEADGKTLISQALGSERLPPNDAKPDSGSALINCASEVRSKKSDSAVNGSPVESRPLTRTSTSRRLETKENKFRGRPVGKVKSTVARTLDSVDVVKTRALRTSSRANKASVSEKERPSASTVSRFRTRGVKASAKNGPQATASQASAVQGTVASVVADSVFTNSDSSCAQGGRVREAVVVGIGPTSEKTRGVKRVATEEISADLCSSSAAGKRTIQNDKPKKQKVDVEDLPSSGTVPERRLLKQKIPKPKKLKILVEDSVEDLPSSGEYLPTSGEDVPSSGTLPERRLLKKKIPKPKKLLPNTSQEKALMRAQHDNIRKSIGLKEIELKVKPSIYQHWKVVPKSTVDFVVDTMMRCFDEKMVSQKVDCSQLMKCLEELKTRIISKVSTVKVPSSKQPVDYLALSTQQATLEKDLKESMLNVGQIKETIASLKKDNEKLKGLRDSLRSKQTTTFEAEHLYESGQSQSTVPSIHATEHEDTSVTEAG